MSAQAIREGLAANLEAAIGGMQVSPYVLANATPPAVEVAPAETTYDLAAGRGLDRWRFTIRAFVGTATDMAGQRRLDQLLAPSGPASVKQAIEAEPTLGGAADDVRVVSASGLRIYERAAGSQVLGAEWTVEVYASGQ